MSGGEGYNIAGLIKDGLVKFVDSANSAAHWLDTDCGSCGAADLTGDGNVWPDDLRDFSANWLAGVE